MTERLQCEIVAVVWQFHENRPQLFEGSFADGRFQMSRLVRGRNSIRTCMDGRISQASSGSRIDVELRVHPVVALMRLVFAAIGLMVASRAATELSPEARRCWEFWFRPGSSGSSVSL